MLCEGYPYCPSIISCLIHTQIIAGVSEQVDSQEQNAVRFCVYCVLRVAKGSC